MCFLDFWLLVIRIICYSSMLYAIHTSTLYIWCTSKKEPNFVCLFVCEKPEYSMLRMLHSSPKFLHQLMPLYKCKLSYIYLIVLYQWQKNKIEMYHNFINLLLRSTRRNAKEVLLKTVYNTQELHLQSSSSQFLLCEICRSSFNIWHANFDAFKLEYEKFMD